MTAMTRTGTRRLLGHAEVDFAAHERRLGPLPWQGGPRRLVAMVEAAGLTGRGGSGFPTWRKMAAVAATGRKAVVVANGAEGEPASAKDRTLLLEAPHLVLDGLQLAAEAVAASRVYAYVRADAADTLLRAVNQRRRRDRYRVAIAAAPSTFLAGEESAVVAALDGRPALPRDTVRRVFEAGVGGAPTLVQNVETLAHLALIARLGPAWFRQLGTASEPGTLLVTVSGTVAIPGVHEIAYGTGLGEVVAAAGGATAPLQALLIGGFHGVWAATLPQTPLSHAGLRPLGASPGSGVLLALPVERCGVVESAHVLTFLAEQSSGQCGPCLNGLPRLAATFAALARAERDPRLPAQVEHLAALVSGRGACHHPDGTARFIRSALHVFGPEVALHLTGRCSLR